MTDGRDGKPDEFTLASLFDDVDRFSDAAHGWNLDFRQLDRGAFRGELIHIITPGVMLSRCRLGRKMEQRGEVPEGYRTFGLPAGDALDLRWRGKRLGADCIMLFPPNRELDSVSNPGFDVFVVSVSEAVLAKAASRRDLDSVDELFPPTEVVACRRSSRLGLVKFAEKLSDAGTTRPSLLHSWAYRDDLEDALVEKLLDAIHCSSPADPRSIAQTRARALRRALDVIAERAREPVTVAELERLSGASGRTLRYAFAEQLGLSPKQYLQAYRLNRVQRCLQRSHPDATTVSKVAKAWGFWHLGQFAADYGRMFGELPSDTLARGR